MPSRLSSVLVFIPLTLAAGTLIPQGPNLTVTSANLRVIFNGADVTGIVNQLTGESYLRANSSGQQLNLTLVQPPTAPLAPGVWTLNADGSAATLTFSDSNRTVSVTVSVDPATQEIVVNLDGKAAQGGVERLAWSAAGFDMGAGQFILPAQGGLALSTASFAAATTYNFSAYAWEAPLALFQGAQGGIAIYSTDTHSLCKDLGLSGAPRQTANALFQVEAPGPWKSAVEAGPIEWRLAAYTGEWQAGARIYRDWHNAALPPAPLTGARAWAGNIRTVIEVDGGHPYQNSTLDALAAVVVPSQTLLYLVDWRSNTYDVGYPDYSWDPSTPAFVTYAHKLGFYVMLHTDVLGVAPGSADFASVQQYQVKDPLNLQPEGWNWNQPPSTPQRYALIDPAASAYRQLFLARVTPAVQTLHPDALHLDFSVISNDGNGLIEGSNFNQGLAQLHRDLLAAFPNLVLGTEETNDMIAPWGSFSQPLFWSAMNLQPGVVAPVPVSAYVLGNVHRYWHLGVHNPYEAGFVPDLAQYEGQAVLPTFHSGVSSYTQPDMARFMNVIGAFQKYNLQPAWDTPWNGAEVLYQGANASASLTDSGTLVQLTLQQSGSSSVLYRRAHGVNQINSPYAVPNWPAYNGTLTLGLDPATQYWLDTPSANPALPHITALPSGARLGLGTGTLVTPQFSYFQLLPPASQSGFNFFNLWQANTGVTYNGVDYPLGNGAVAQLQNMTVGGATRQAIFAHPPYTAQVGGETFLEYSVPVPSARAALSFAAGIQDAAIGQRQGPMTFKVEIAGAILWQQDVSNGPWQAGSIDLLPWAGQTVKIRFVSNPGPAGNPSFAWGGWSALQLSPLSAPTLDGITLAAPASATVALTGGSATAGNGTVTVNGLPYSGTVLAFTGSPVAFSSGQSLLNIPSTLSQSANGQVAGLPLGAFQGTGAIAPTTSGGVTKQQTIYAFAPPVGQTIFSWLLQLPASPLAFSFSAGYWDGVSPPAPQGYLMSVRINGTVLWQRNINVPPSWQYGALDLSPWSGQTILLELITDSLGPNYDDFTSWGDLLFGSASGASCLPSLATTEPISVPASGANQSFAVTAGSVCSWTVLSAVDWITATPATAAGSRTASITVAPNPGPARQATVVVAGHTIAVSQAGAAAFSGPEISTVVSIAGGARVTAPNAWLEIHGINLASGTRPWQASDFVNGQMPTQLDGVSATVNGKPAFVEYISPGQVNVLSPLDTTQGTVQVQVSIGGLTSPPVYVPMQTAAPGFFLFGGGPYVAATHVDGSYLGPTSLYPGATTPARPGETVTLYAGGFGQTSPALVNGSQTQSGNLPTLPQITVGGAPATVQFAGAVSPGLYQFNIVIPDTTPDGDQPLAATYAGFSTQSGVLISVRR